MAEQKVTIMPMNEEVKKLWLDALRSGELKQGRGQLKMIVGGEAEYCCLGVLCEVYVRTNKVNWEQSGYCCSLYGATGLLPYEVCEWSGLDESNPIIDNPIKDRPSILTENLTGLNDEFKLSFKEIANLIEENL